MEKLKRILRRQSNVQNFEDDYFSSPPSFLGAAALNYTNNNDRKTTPEQQLQSSGSMPNLKLNLDKLTDHVNATTTSTTSARNRPHSTSSSQSPVSIVTSPLTETEFVTSPATEPILPSSTSYHSRSDNSISSSRETPRTYKKRSSSFNGRLSSRIRSFISDELMTPRTAASHLLINAADYQFNFHLVLQNRETCGEFLAYLKRTGCPEGLEFMMACDDLAQRVTHLNVINQTKHASSNDDDALLTLRQSLECVMSMAAQKESDTSDRDPEQDLRDLYDIARGIYEQYIEPRSFKEVNISGEIRNWIYLEMIQLQLYFQHKSGPLNDNKNKNKTTATSSSSTPRSLNNKNGASTATQEIPHVDLETFRSLFKMAYNSVRVNLESDSFHRFVRSEQWNAYFCKNFVRIFSMNKGMAVHRSKIQIKQMNRTDFVREYITDRDIDFATSLMNSSQFWTLLYEKPQLNRLKVFHSANECALDRKATESFGFMPVIKQEAIYRCSHHELIKLITSQEYGNMIGFLGTDITNCISGKRPITYTNLEYRRSHERSQRIKSMQMTSRGSMTPRGIYTPPRSLPTSPTSPNNGSPLSADKVFGGSQTNLSKAPTTWEITKDRYGERVYNTSSFICEVPSASRLEKKKQLAFCSSTIYDPDKKCYYYIFKPAAILEADINPKCLLIHAFITIIIQEIEEDVCKFILFASSNGDAATTYIGSQANGNESTTHGIGLDDSLTEELDEQDHRLLHASKTESKLKHGAKKQCYLILDALLDWERRPKLTDLCYAGQSLRDNTREEDEDKARVQKQKESERRFTSSFFQSLRRRVSTKSESAFALPSMSTTSKTPEEESKTEIPQLSLANTPFFQNLLKHRNSKRVEESSQDIATPTIEATSETDNIVQAELVREGDNSYTASNVTEEETSCIVLSSE